MSRFSRTLSIIIAIMLCAMCTGACFGLYTRNAVKNVSIGVKYPTSLDVVYSGGNLSKNGTLDRSTVTATVGYNDGSTNVVTDWTDNLDTSTTGDKTVTVTYGAGATSVTDTFNLAVTDYQGDCTLLGINGDWWQGRAMIVNSGASGTEYMIQDVEIPANSSLSIYYNGNLYNNIKGYSPIGTATVDTNNFSLTTASRYDIYFTVSHSNPSDIGIYIDYHKIAYTLTWTKNWIGNDGAKVLVWAWSTNTDGKWYDATYVQGTNCVITTYLPTHMTGAQIGRFMSTVTPATATWTNTTMWNKSESLSFTTGVTAYTYTVDMGP